jgi:hypothetical protein
MENSSPTPASTDWNPYCEWLAIPPSQTPPTPQQLLGLLEDELDIERIERSSQRQLRRIEPHLHGPMGLIASRLLSEITSATEQLTSRALAAQGPLNEPESRPTEVVASDEGVAELLAEDPADLFPVDSARTSRRGPASEGATLRILVTASLATVSLLSLAAVLIVWWPDRSTQELASPPAIQSPAEAAARPAAGASLAEREGCWRRVDRPVEAKPWDLAEASVTRIEEASTPAEESFPSLTSEGRSLLWARRVGRKTEIHRLSRSQGSESWDVESVCTLEALGTTTGSVIERELNTLVLARYRGGGTDFAEAWVDPGASRHRVLSLLAPIRGAERDVWMSMDGERLWYSRKVDRVYHIFEARRVDASRPFEPPLLAGIVGGFRHPSVSEDRRLMVMEGLASDGRVALFYARRPREGSPWSEPRCLESIRASTGTRGDFTPRLSRDGSWLLWASDREGGSGLLDLYRAPTHRWIPAE